MTFDASHRQTVLHHLSKELTVASVMLRIASETPTSPMNQYLSDRMHNIATAIRHIKEVASGTWTVDGVMDVVPAPMVPELRRVILKLKPPPVIPFNFLDRTIRT